MRNIFFNFLFRYTVISVYEINGLRLLKLRNPWGRTQKGYTSSNPKEWTGAYSDNDTRNWTPKLKKQVGFVKDSKDAIFFMQWKDFLKYFRSVYVCHYRNDHVLSSVPDINGANTIACYQFNIKKSGNCYFGLSQPDERKFGKYHKYGNMSVIVCRMEGKKVKFVCGKGGKERDPWAMAHCPQGKYIAIVTTSWHQNSKNENKFSFWCYCREAVKIMRIQKKENLQECQAILGKGLIDYVSFPFFYFYRRFNKKLAGSRKMEEESTMRCLLLDTLSRWLKLMLILEEAKLGFYLKVQALKEVKFIF